jgi:GT2 family glycosyltransferase
MRYALEAMRPRYLLLLNNDVVVAPGLVGELLASAGAAPRVGMWQPKVLMMRRPGTISGIGIGIHPNGQTFMIGYGEPDDGRHDAPREIFAVYGCAVLCDVRMLEEVGLFEEGFFAYYEDVELSWRALLHGWRCMYVPSARVHHWEGASGAPLKGMLNLRNGIYCNLKCAPADLLMRMLMRAGLEFTRFMLTATAEERRECLGLAWRFGLLGPVPGMLRGRSALRARRLETVPWLRRMMEPASGTRQGLVAKGLASLTSAGRAAAKGVEHAREDA